MKAQQQLGALRFFKIKIEPKSMEPANEAIAILERLDETTEELPEMDLSAASARDDSNEDGDVDKNCRAPMRLLVGCGMGDSDDHERGYVVVEAVATGHNQLNAYGSFVGGPAPPPPQASLPPNCTTAEELAALVNTSAVKVDALAHLLAAFMVARALEDRMLNAMRFRSECVLIDRVSIAQVGTIKRAFEIELIASNRHRQESDSSVEYDPRSPENAPFAWLAGVSTHDPAQIHDCMQYLRS